jgi:hypothetical protein
MHMSIADYMLVKLAIFKFGCVDWQKNSDKRCKNRPEESACCSNNNCNINNTKQHVLIGYELIIRKPAGATGGVRAGRGAQQGTPNLHFVAGNGHDILLCPSDKAQRVERQLELWGGAYENGGDLLLLGSPAKLQADQPLSVIGLRVPLSLPATRKYAAPSA